MSNSNEILNQFTKLYHGSKNGELRKDEKHKYSCLYVTPVFAYAAMYSSYINSTHGCVFEMTPVRSLNIFDANDENALEELKVKVEELNPGNTLVNQIKWNDLKTKDWSTVCFRKDEIRDDLLLKAVKDLGYDGYLNIEWDEGCAETFAEGLGGCSEVVNSISIGIFDENLLEVVDEKYFDDYSDDELFNKCHQADEDLFIKFLQDEGLGDFYYDDETTAKDWAADNLPFLDVDEVNDLFDTYANCYDEEDADYSDESSKKKNLTNVLGEQSMRKLKESIILHFDLDDGTHKAIPFNSEEEALDYMDSDEFPVGEWVGSYTIEPVDSVSNDDEDDYDEPFYIVLDRHFYRIKEPVGEIYRDVNFSNKDDAIVYALEHPEVHYVQEMFGPDLCDCYEGDFVWERDQENIKLKEASRKFKERVLDYDTYDKYYDEGAEAYFEGKSLDEVPVTGNAWFREAWQEGWKNAKAYDDEGVRRAEAEYEEELEQEEAYREGLTESKNPKRVKEAAEKKSIKDWIESEMTDEIKDDVYEFLKCSDKYYPNDLVTYKQFENIMFSNGFDDQDYMWKPLI